MEELKQILEKLESMETRLNKLEGRNEEKSVTLNHTTTVSPDEMDPNTVAFVGRFTSLDGNVRSKFGHYRFEIKTLYDCNSFEMAQVIDAFANEDRVNIIKELMTRNMTAKELMDKLGFQTTGKLYHHLSFLEKIGVLKKDGEVYHINARYVSCIVLIAVGVAQIIRKNHD